MSLSNDLYLFLNKIDNQLDGLRQLNIEQKKWFNLMDIGKISLICCVNETCNLNIIYNKEYTPILLLKNNNNIIDIFDTSYTLTLKILQNCPFPKLKENFIKIEIFARMVIMSLFEQCNFNIPRQSSS